MNGYHCLTTSKSFGRFSRSGFMNRMSNPSKLRPNMGRKASAEGKRLKIHDYSAAKNMPTLILGGENLYLWDGEPSIFDAYD